MLKKTAAILLTMILLLPLSSIAYAVENAETPTIGTHPADITVLVGEAATLTVEASVTLGTLSYQWYSNGTNSNSGGSLISGATANTYSAPTASAGTTYYYCIVTNTDPSATVSTTSTATTNAAAVIVNEPVDAEAPAIDTQPVGVTVSIGDAADLSVTASVGSGTLSYQWYSNAVDSNAGGSIIAGAASATYTAPTVLEGTTYYYCVVTNTDNTATGSTTATATTNTAAVVVNSDAETPTIDAQPVGATVLVGEAATVSVTASVGTGTLSYQWYSNADNNNTTGTLIPLATAASYSAPTASEGTTYYYCVVTNTDLSATGSTTATATTNTAAVLVRTSTGSTTVPRPAYAETPTILSQPTGASVSIGEPVTVSVRASVSSGTLSYQWYRNGGAVPGAVSSSYAVPTTAAGTAYYYCVVTNTDTVARETTASATSRAAEVTAKVVVSLVNEPLDEDTPDETHTDQDESDDTARTEIDLRDSTVLSRDEISELVTKNETEPVILSGEGYTMTFPTGAMDTTDFEEIDFGARVGNGTDFPEIAEASGGHPVLVASFNHSGELPGEATIVFNAGAEYAGQTLYYYYYNDATGTLEFRQSTVVDSEGNITVTQSSCSDYVLTETPVEEQMSPVPAQEPAATPIPVRHQDTAADDTPGTDGFPWIYFLIGGLLIIDLGLILFIRRKRR